MVKELFDSLGKLTDILNVGRLLFYTSAGALVVLPLYMLGVQLTHPSATLIHQFEIAGKTLGGQTGWLVGLSAVVTGFVIAGAGFPLLLDRVGAAVARELAVERKSSRAYAYPRNYPLLSKKATEDYAAWLISEYYRYIEIVTYVPAGLIVGLGICALWAAAAVAMGTESGSPGMTEAHWLLIGLVLMLGIVTQWFWPEVWVRKVITPAVRTYLVAKRDVIDGVKEFAGPSSS